MNENLTIKKSYVEVIRRLPVEEQLEVWNAIFDYGFEGETSCNHGIFEIIKPNIKVRKIKQKNPDVSYKTWDNEQFISDIRQYLPEYGRDMLNNFYRYWSEKAPEGKMKFQMEETWETKLRLIRWKSNNFDKSTEQFKSKGFKTEINNK